MSLGLLFPLLVLGLVEVGLRVSNYGYPTGYWLETEIHGERCWIPNEAFSRRFFPRQLARSPNLEVVKASKPADTRRVVVFGESAALGDPQPAFGFSRYLEVLLEQSQEEVSVEVICVAMTAINSHAIVEIAEDCLVLDADAWIVYMGNNEMAGPFGALSVLGRPTPHPWLLSGSLFLKEFRVGQALSAFLLGDSKQAAPETWGGVNMFADQQVALKDPAREAVYRNFERNLQRLVSLSEDHGITTLLCSVASNLSNSGPFKSSSLVGDKEQEWFEGVRTSIEQGRFQSAAESLALLKESGNESSANYQFATAYVNAFLGVGDQPDAGFRAARDLDLLPFRMDSRMNETVAQVASAASRQVQFVDIEGALAADSVKEGVRLLGEALFWDHVHFKPEGNYRVALILGEALRERFDLKVTHPWLDFDSASKRLALSSWDRRSAIENMMKRLDQAPFDQRIGHLDSMVALRNAYRRLDELIHPREYYPTQELYLNALSHRPGDIRVMENYAGFLEASGELEEALRMWKTLEAQLPWHFGPPYHLGRLMHRAGDLAGARPYLERSHGLRPEVTETRLELAATYGDEDPGKALSMYSEIARDYPHRPDIHYRMAQIHGALEDRAAATKSLRKAIEVNPNYWQARYYLGVELAMEGDLAAAESEFRTVVELRPQYALGHLNLGVSLARQKRFKEAEPSFQQAAQLDPENETAKRQLDLVRSILSQSQGTGAED